MSVVIVNPDGPSEEEEPSTTEQQLEHIDETVDEIKAELETPPIVVEDTSPHICDPSCPCHEEARVASEAARIAIEMAEQAHCTAVGIAKFLCEDDMEDDTEEVTEIAPTPDREEHSDRRHNLIW